MLVRLSTFERPGNHCGLLLADCFLGLCLKGVLFNGNLDMQYVKVIMLMTKTWLQPELEEESSLSDCSSSVTRSTAKKHTLHRHCNYACMPTGKMSVTFCQYLSAIHILAVMLRLQKLERNIQTNWCKLNYDEPKNDCWINSFGLLGPCST